MKRIRGLEAPPQGLAEYRDQEGDAATWDGFGSHRGSSDAKRELAQALADIQHGLCGYCENALHPRDREIEHVVPKSYPARGTALALDHTNLIACCRGGASEPHAAELRSDPSRFLPPVRANRSCGQAKGDALIDDCLDPRSLPTLPSLFRVQIDGEVAPDGTACRSLGVDAARVEVTIRTLGLNVPRLRAARAAHWRALLYDWDHYDGDHTKIRAAATRELLPDQSGALPHFFTTTRSFFGPLAEQVLDEPDLSWV